MATQNPLDQHGRLDRFAVALSLGSRAPAYERVVVQEQLSGATVYQLQPVVAAGQLIAARDRVRSTHVAYGAPGRDFVLPDDIKQAAVPCLAHRLATVAGPGVSAADVVHDVLSRVGVPVRR